MKADFQSNLQSRLEDPSLAAAPSLENMWDHLKFLIAMASEEVLGFASKKNKDWFDENNQEIQELLAKKRSALQAHRAQPGCPGKKAAFCLACSNLQHELRVMKNEWWNAITEKTQLCADTCNYRGFYKALKTVYVPSYKVQSPLRSTDGQALLTDNSSILSRWSQHFQTLFSADRTVHDAAILCIPQQPVKAELDEIPSLEEITKAVQQLKCGKAAGVDGIHGGHSLHSNSMICSHAVGSKANFHKISVMQSSLPCIKTRERSQTAPTTVA